MNDMRGAARGYSFRAYSFVNKICKIGRVRMGKGYRRSRAWMGVVSSPHRHGVNNLPMSDSGEHLRGFGRMWWGW